MPADEVQQAEELEVGGHRPCHAHRGIQEGLLTDAIGDNVIGADPAGFATIDHLEPVARSRESRQTDILWHDFAASDSVRRGAEVEPVCRRYFTVDQAHKGIRIEAGIRAQRLQGKPRRFQYEDARLIHPCAGRTRYSVRCQREDTQRRAGFVKEYKRSSILEANSNAEVQINSLSLSAPNQRRKACTCHRALARSTSED